MALITAAACGGEGGSADARGSGDGNGNGNGNGNGSGSGVDVGTGVTVHLQRVMDGAAVLSFGLPLPAGAVKDVGALRVLVNGAPAPASVRETLADLDAEGGRVGARAALIQLPAELMPGESLDVEVQWSGGAGASDGAITPFTSDQVSAESTAMARTTERTIAAQGGGHALVEGPIVERPLFTGREPRVLATFPPGYLARAGVLGPQVAAGDVAPGLAGLSSFSTALEGFTRSAMYRETYALNPHPESVVDPIQDYSGWLYDRCATFLTAYIHLGDAEALRHAYRSCSWYARKIELSGPDAGTFTGKPYPDTKYSHVRGLYAYYALTGDEAALEAGRAMAELWANDGFFVVPYREGHTRGIDKLWTERLLATSMEGLLYGHRLTGDPRYLTAFGEMFETAYRHVTGDAAALASINPGVSFPPQGCFIHTGEQHADALADDPWCSPWMSAMLVDPLLAWEEQTGDERVSEIFIQLSRFLRDVGTSYFTNDLLNDSFLSPSVCDDPNAGGNRRRLVPLYGAGIRQDGSRATFGEWDDWQHCADATALTAAGLRALRRTGGYDGGPIGPFASEGEALLALHRELASCAARGFAQETRTNRDPATWTSAQLAAGAGNPAAFIAQNRIGFPLHVVMPQRRLSWWFNGAMLQLALLADAGIEVPEVATGAVQPPGCP